MKKYANLVSLAAALILFLLFSTSCTFSELEIFNFDTSVEKSLSVTLVYNNGTEDEIFSVQSGHTFKTPEDPKKENYIFMGWYCDKELTEKYDFADSVTKNITLYAKYTIDGATITNELSKETIKSVVKIYNKSYNTKFGMETSETISQGSGFCFYSKDGYYYILTNCHVVLKETSYSKQKITIEDYQGNTYTGYIYKNSITGESAIDPTYDLACIYFESYSTNVQTLEMSSSPEIGDDVISLGSPQGQTNFITYGKVSDFKQVAVKDTTEDRSNVTFDVIEHTSYIDSGSSGGPVLNASLQVVGVNYAGNDKTESENVYSYAIPAEKVNEFLERYLYCQQLAKKLNSSAEI